MCNYISVTHPLESFQEHQRTTDESLGNKETPEIKQTKGSDLGATELHSLLRLMIKRVLQHTD